MTTFRIIRREFKLEFAIKTTAKVTSYEGTAFVPNHCETTVYDGQIIAFTLSRLDGNGWGIDDPAGPDGAELYVSYAGGEIDSEGRARLPKVAQEALAEIEGAI